MTANRSMPQGTIIPELGYPDVRTAVDWLCRVFDFRERLRTGNHRAQLTLGAGSVIVTRRSGETGSPDANVDHSIVVSVGDVDAHQAGVGFS